MNKELITIPGIDVFNIIDETSGFEYPLFRSTDKSFITALKYDPFEINGEEFWLSLSEKLNTLLYNRIKFEEKTYASEEDILSFIESNIIRYTPQEKINNSLEYLSQLTHYDGQTITSNIFHDISVSQIWRKYYFQNAKEFFFYIENLSDQGLVVFTQTKEGISDLNITLAGLTALTKINQQKTSRHCFIAMSFDETLKYVYTEAILPALEATGFIPFIVSSEHLTSEITINDAIIAGIKKAHFTIADFTQHKAGVYFEAGYALGRGQKVIYTCRNDEIKDASFDTRNYQHIVWETSEDLKQSLMDKINAIILD